MQGLVQIGQQCSVVLPAYEEADRIGALIRAIRSILPDAEIIVVDDGSRDATHQEAENAGARVVRHPYNKGNGASVRTGIRAASGDIVVMMDADGQHDPHEIPELLTLFPEYDMVVGARSSKGQAGKMRGLGNHFYNRFASWLTGFQIEDLTSGFRAFKREKMMPFLHLFPSGYSYPTTSILAFLKAGYNLKFVPITCSPRQGGRSGIKILRDGGRFFLIIMKLITLFSPMRVFLPISGFFWVTGLGYSAFTLLEGRFTNMAALLLIMGALVFLMGLIAEQLAAIHTQGQR